MRKILALLLCMALMGCVATPVVEQAPQGPVYEQYYEVSEHDVLKLLDEGTIVGPQVTVKGAKIGDSLPQVIKKVGMPYVIDEFLDNGTSIVNARYVNEDNRTTYIFNIVDDEVERITIRDGFAAELINKSRMEQYTLANITRTFGKPDEMEDSIYARTYEYHDEGLEIYHKRKQMIAFALVDPITN